MTLTTVGEFLEHQGKGEIINYNNPSCKDCNDCCSMGTLLTKEEYLTLEKYIRKDRTGKRLFIEAVERIMPYYKKGTIYWMCPFSNGLKRCSIYHMRPQICKDFHCDPNLRLATYDKGKYAPEEHYEIFDLFKKRIWFEMDGKMMFEPVYTAHERPDV